MQFDSFIFIHIPKCGGTSFRSFISNVAGKNGVSTKEMHIPGFNGVEFESNLSQLTDAERIKLKGNQFKVIADHTRFGAHESLGINGLMKPFYYTLFRDPVSRFISHYNFFNYSSGSQRFRGKRLNQLSSESFDHIVTGLSNLQVRFLTNIENYEIDDALLKKAKNNLKNNFSAHGVLENLSLSFKVLKTKMPDWLQFEDEDMPHLNKLSELPLEELSQTRCDKIRAMNKYDIELYDFALELLDRDG